MVLAHVEVTRDLRDEAKTLWVTFAIKFLNLCQKEKEK